MFAGAILAGVGLLAIFVAAATYRDPRWTWVLFGGMLLVIGFGVIMAGAK